MAFEYIWKNNEANFGPPLEKEVDGGTHITFEIILKKGDQYIALRRQSIPDHESPPNIEKHPRGLLFFCHNLIRYGESIEQCVKRTVKEQTGVNVLTYKVIDIETTLMEESGGKKIKQWSFTPYFLAELEELPKPGNYGNEVTEVVAFDEDNIPEDFGWWTKEELYKFLKEVKV